jgi:GMP synthase (glutamine-hydrolysing)
MFETLRYLLLQVRNPDDPMREHEVRCFARALRCAPRQIRVVDLLAECPSLATLDTVDVVLLGGSGDYSVAEGGPWFEPALEAMRDLDAVAKPTFASCWGFQAMARALGGEVVTDPLRAEVGSLVVKLTPEGERDPVLGPLGSPFRAQMGHQDIVERLPPGAELLASTDLVTNQAFRLRGKPIYCSQFHPELDRDALIVRIRQYPRYAEEVMGISIEDFIRYRTRPSPVTDVLLTRFIEHVLGS